MPKKVEERWKIVYIFVSVYTISLLLENSWKYDNWNNDPKTVFNCLSVQNLDNRFVKAEQEGQKVLLSSDLGTLQCSTLLTQTGWPPVTMGRLRQKPILRGLSLLICHPQRSERPAQTFSCGEFQNQAWRKNRMSWVQVCPDWWTFWARVQSVRADLVVKSLSILFEKLRLPGETPSNWKGQRKTWGIRGW